MHGSTELWIWSGDPPPILTVTECYAISSSPTQEVLKLRSRLSISTSGDITASSPDSQWELIVSDFMHFTGTEVVISTRRDALQDLIDSDPTLTHLQPLADIEPHTSIILNSIWKRSDDSPSSQSAFSQHSTSSPKHYLNSSQTFDKVHHMAKPSKLVVYTNGNDETFITTKDREDTFIDEYFTRGMRDLEDFARTESQGSCVEVTSSIRIGID